MAKKKASKKKPVSKKVVKKTTSSKKVKKMAKKVPARVIKKTVKKTVKKTASKVSRKSVKKATTKSALKTSKKAASKSVKKPTKKVVKKAATPKAKATSAKVMTTNSKPVKGASAKSTPLVLPATLVPLDDRILVRLAGAERMTAGGLYIPDTVSDVSGNLQGEVVAVGRGHRNKKGHVRPMDVRVGDQVVFAEFAGSKINIQNEDLLILREGDVLGIVSK